MRILYTFLILLIFYHICMGTNQAASPFALSLDELSQVAALAGADFAQSSFAKDSKDGKQKGFKYFRF